MVIIAYVVAADPEASASAPIPPSIAATLFSKTSDVGFIILVYIFPASLRSNKSAPC